MTPKRKRSRVVKRSFCGFFATARNSCAFRGGQFRISGVPGAPFKRSRGSLYRLPTSLATSASMTMRSSSSSTI